MPERNVFKYRRLDKDYYFDPIDVYLNLVDVMEQNGIDPEVIAKQQASNQVEQMRFSRRMAYCVLEAFKLKPFSNEAPDGWTIQEALELLQAFNDYSLSLKKNTEESQSAAPSTEQVT